MGFSRPSRPRAQRLGTPTLPDNPDRWDRINWTSISMTAPLGPCNWEVRCGWFQGYRKLIGLATATVFVLFWFGLFSKQSHVAHWPQTDYVPEKNTELLIVLPLPPECCNHSWAQLCLAYWVPEVELRSLCTLGKHSANWAKSPVYY